MIQNTLFQGVVAVGLSAVLGIAITGCERRVGPRPDWRPKVEMEQKNISLSTSSSHLSLSQAEMADAAAFVQSKTTGKSAVYAHLQTSDMGWLNRYSGQGTLTLRSQLEKLGLNRHRFESIIQFTPELKGSRLVLERYSVSAPANCVWDEIMDGSTSPNGEVNFGCANAHNLAAMIAEPRDLYRSEVRREFDATLGVKTIADYRNNDIKTSNSSSSGLMTGQNSSNSGGSGGGGSSGGSSGFSGLIGAATGLANVVTNSGTSN